MKKLLLVLPLFAGASWAGTTYYSGSQTQPAYDKLLEQLNDASRLTVESKEYNAGFMQSTAITKVKFSTREDSDVLFHLKHTINHSPIDVTPTGARFGPADIVTTLQMEAIDNAELQEFLASFDTGEPFVLRTKVNFDGSTDNNFVLNSVEYAKDDKITLTAQGAAFDVAMDRDGFFSGTGIFNELQVVAENEMNIKTAPMTTDFQGQRIGRMTYNGSSRFEIPRVEFSSTPRNARSNELTLSDIVATSDQQMKGDTYSNSSVSIGRIDNSDIPLNSIAYELNIAGFSADAFAAYADFIGKLEDPASAQDDQQVLLEGTAIARQMIQPNTSIDLKTTAANDQGNMSANVNITFIGNGTPDGYDGMQTARDLARSITATASIDADTAAIMSLPMGAMLMDPGISDFVSITDEKVTASANLTDLQLNIKDQTLPLDMMFGDMLDLPLEMVMAFLQ